MIDFSKQLLGSTAIKYIVFFNEVQEIIDFKAFHAEKEVTITFEPGVPEHDDYADEWIEIK
jgi:hypothetical protein